MAGRSSSVLFVCLGNICRSPLAQAVMEREVAQAGANVVVDSAGVGAYHVGEPPHHLGRACARRHGLDSSAQRARQISVDDVEAFDLVVCMDESNVSDFHTFMRRRGVDKESVQGKVRLLTDFTEIDGDVEDCYYAPDVEASFESVFALFEEACPAILSHLVSLE